MGPWDGKGWEKAYGDFNPIISLGFLRVFLRAMIDVSTDLKRDEDRRTQWKHILANLSELPTATQDGRKRFRACEGGHGSGAEHRLRLSLPHPEVQDSLDPQDGGRFPPLRMTKKVPTSMASS